MKPELLPEGLRGERWFRWRGGDVSRLEALSDAVFALSLTLLVVALEVPRTSEELVRLFWQFPAFGICFAFILRVWYEHYLYHRRYGFEDAPTVAQNGWLTGKKVERAAVGHTADAEKGTDLFTGEPRE